MPDMSTGKRIFLGIELAAWLGVFAWLFGGRDATANLIFVLPVVLALIGLRMAVSVVAGAFVSVWRGVAGRE